MIREILSAVGVLHRKARFLQPPAETYAVYFDDVETDGPDPVPFSTTPPQIYKHSISVELYEPRPDDATEAAIEAALNARGVAWAKEDRYWLQDVQRYQVIYTFNYTEKRS